MHARRGAYLGAGAVIGEHLTIGEFSLVGMGAVVTKDIPACEVWAGVPARRLRAAAVDLGTAVGPVPGEAWPGGQAGSTQRERKT